MTNYNKMNLKLKIIMVFYIGNYLGVCLIPCIAFANASVIIHKNVLGMSLIDMYLL